MTQLEMFPVPPSPVRAVKPKPGSGVAVYSPCTARNKPRCEDCVRVQMLDPQAGAAHLATLIRTENGQRTYLCYEHARAWKEADGLA